MTQHVVDTTRLCLCLCYAFFCPNYFQPLGSFHAGSGQDSVELQLFHSLCCHCADVCQLVCLSDCWSSQSCLLVLCTIDIACVRTSLTNFFSYLESRHFGSGSHGTRSAFSEAPVDVLHKFSDCFHFRGSVGPTVLLAKYAQSDRKDGKDSQRVH